MSNILLCASLEAQLKSAEEERMRLVQDVNV
jgi:hypothetical protein